jgi:bacillithiol synthase
MGCTFIPYTRVPKASALLTDYLYNFDRVSRFYSAAPFDPASIGNVAGKLNISIEARRKVAEILTRQNQAFGSGQTTFENIRLLAEPGTVAVVTGQQVGLLTGPVFTLYKALTAVRLAQSLAGQGLRAVPVFWLATEDHDLEEVAHAAVLDEDYNLVALRDSGARPAERSSVGYVQLTEEITEGLGRLESLLPAGEPRERLMADLRECYAPGATWGMAFGRLMARLFSRWGVILLDPLDEDIHRLAEPVYEHALTSAQKLRRRLLDRWAELVRTGHHAQVHVPEDSTLVFVTREGNRLPLHQQNGEFRLDETQKYASAELVKQMNAQPLDFSPNVLLRPVVQDALLPTVAYVAGPSELAYFGQAQVLYESFGRPMPVIFPRAAFTLVDRRVHRLMEKYQVSVEDVWQGKEHLNRKIAAAGFAEGGAPGWSERFDEGERDLAALLERLRREIESLDPTLLDSLKHSEEKMKYQMEKLRGKISRAALQKSELLARHEESLLRFLTPRKDLQEREVSGIYFLGRAGYDLLDRLLEQTQVNSSDHQILIY